MDSENGGYEITLDERRLTKYKEVMDFMGTNHRNSSRHRLAGHLMVNFIKHIRKLLKRYKKIELRNIEGRISTSETNRIKVLSSNNT